MDTTVKNLSVNPDYVTYSVALDKVYHFTETGFPFPVCEMGIISTL